MAKYIAGPDDLDKAELRKCFEVLHACGRATDPNATLASTRRCIDRFLEAVFSDWTSDSQDELLKPELDFSVSAETVVGMICGEYQIIPRLSRC